MSKSLKQYNTPMAWLIFCFTITILINNVSPYTTIAGGTTWTDSINNTAPNYYQTYTTPSTGNGDYWFYPEYRSDRANDQNGLAGVTGNVPGTGELIWGWWNFYGQTIDNTWTEDPNRSMVRYFECGSFGTVDISFNFFMCTEGYNSGDGTSTPIGMSSATAVTMKRISVSQGDNILYRRYDHSCWSNYGGSNPSGVACTNQVRRCRVSESFNTNGPGDIFILKVTWESTEHYAGSTWFIAGMNGLQITCNQIPTAAPTISPTNPTKTPTKTPSKSPAKTHTKSPTPAPTGNPTRNPTTYKPTKSPSTQIPSKFPSKHPTNDPTQTPTMDPTNNPTRKPTKSPIPKPTSKPTKKPSQKPTISPSAIPSSIPTLSPSPNPTISLILKQGEICIDGYKEAANEAYCEPCGVNEAGTFGSCNECGAGKQPNNNHTQCLLCDDNFIGLDGHCDIDCSQNNKIANELHNECVAMEKETEKEHWYATAEFDAAISGIGVLTGCSCIGAILYAFCKKKLCCAKSKDVTVTDENNEIKNLNTATNANQRIQIVSK